MSRTAQWILMLGLMSASLAVNAQGAMNALIRSAYADPEVKTIQDQITYLETRPYKLSPLRELEFRTRSNQLEPDRQDYGIRLSPTNPWERKNNRLYFEQFETSLRAEYDLTLKKILRDRYSLAIDGMTAQTLLELTTEYIQLSEKRVAFLERQVGSGRFDADELIEGKLELMEQYARRDELRLEILDLESQMSALAGVSVSLVDLSTAASTEVIRGALDSLAPAGSSSNLRYREAQVNLAQKHVDLERSNVNVGFLQTQYESYRTEQGREPWTISLGVTIPIANPNKGDMARRQLQTIEARNLLDAEKLEDAADVKRTRALLDQLINYHLEMQSRIGNLNSGSIESLLLLSNNQDATVSLQFQLNLLKLRIIETKTRSRLLEAYIEHLYACDILQRRPLINYLSANGERAE